MRFLLKTAFWLGLVAFFIPFGGTPKETEANITWFGAVIGAQQAFQDMTGFCDRAPQACDTGRELAVFAGERIGDGVAMAYGLVEGRMATNEAMNEATKDAAAPALLAASTDPVTTGALLPAPAAYIPPKRQPAITVAEVEATPEMPAEETVSLRAVPTPSPRP